MENIVHQMLKNGMCIGKVEKHHNVFEMNITGLKKIFHSSPS
jgi:hypothetical protein